jgi:hypothetical protein
MDMSENRLVRFSSYTSDYGIKVPYLLEIGRPQDSNYTAICYPIGNTIFGRSFVLDIDYKLVDGTPVNPYTRYKLGSGSKSNISLTKEILKMIFDKRTKRCYKVGTLSRDLGFEFKLSSITDSSCGILIFVSDGSEVYVNLGLHSLSDILKWGDSNPTKRFYLDLLADTFSTKEALFDCAKQLYKVKNSLPTRSRN